MFDESDDNYVNTFKIKISFKDLEGKSHKKITNIYNKENILGKTWPKSISSKNCFLSKLSGNSS